LFGLFLELRVALLARDGAGLGVVHGVFRELRDEMERAAVSSEGTSGRPPVKSVESVREKRAT
jgi:hypothetical protein